MGEIVQLVGVLTTGIIDVFDGAHPSLKALVWVSVWGWAAVYPIFTIIRRVVFATVVRPNVFGWHGGDKEG